VRAHRLVLALALLVAGVGAVIAAANPLLAEEPVVVTAAPFELSGDGNSEAIIPINAFKSGQALGGSLEYYAAPAPAPGTAPIGAMSNPTHEGYPLVVSVFEESPDGTWLNVRLPQRPNGSTGWVRAADLQLWEVPNRIEVSISERTLRVFEGDSDNVLFETLVAVGAPNTPTPLGDFFVDIVVQLGHDRVYGWGQMSVAGFSEVLQRFAGGIGQIAIHGWNNPSAMGRNVSNGCVRMNNEDIARVYELTGLGTPVSVVA
jgi:lipoprotein-anchoring transpeptidase ErfK/SrfK